MKKAIVFLFLIIGLCQLLSQESALKFYNFNNGLNANSINDIAIDRYNNKWLATNMGLKKFDGYNFVDYDIHNFNRKEIKKIICSKNNLYILYKGGTLIVHDFNKAISRRFTNKKILDFHITPQKIVLLKSNYTIEVIEGKKRTNYILKFSKKSPIQDSESTHAIIVYNNTIYFSIPHMGLYLLKKNKIKLLSHELRVRPGGFRERFKIINNNLYFLGLKQALLIEKNNQLKYFKFKDQSIFITTDLAIKNQWIYYIKNDNSLMLEFNGKTYPIINNLRNIELREIFFSGQNIYLTSNKGIYKLFNTNYAIKQYSLNNHMLVKRKIIELSNHKILFFGYPYVIQKDGDKQTTLTHEIGTIYDAIHVKKKFYMTTDGKGLMIGDENLKTITPLVKNYTENINSLYYDKTSDLIYSGSHKYLYFFNPDDLKVQKINNPFKGFSIKTILKDYNHHRLFVGTDNGIFILNLKNRKISKFISNKMIGDLLIDKKNNFLWVGYENGILIYDTSTLQLVKSITFNFLKNPRVTCLLSDNQNRTWASTYSGLAAYDYSSNNLLELKNSDLINREYNYKSACKLKNGHLIFGGLDGYDEINPSKFDFSNPKIYGRISGYHIIKPNDSIYYNFNNPKTINFKNKNEFLRIYISNYNKVYKNNCSFQYKLDNTNWIDLKQQYIDLVGLAKGKYILQIRGVDEMGKIIKFKPTNIIVSEEFYKSDSFVSGLIFLLLVFIIIFFKSRYNKLKLENKIYEKISMDLHDEVGTILSKTSLLISQNEKIEKDNLTKIQNNIKQANFGLRANINSIKEDDIELIYLYYECIEVMESFLNIKNIHYIHSFEGKKSKKINKNLYKDLKLCFYEIFNNTIKYSTSQDVEVKFIENKNKFSISILEKNNFLNFGEINYGNGLKNLEKRIERNNGKINFISNKNKNTYSIVIKIKL